MAVSKILDRQKSGEGCIMGKKLKRNFIPFIVLNGMLLLNTYSHAQIANGAGKFLGNITTGFQVRSDFITYWNQITGENEHKWASIEGTRDRMNWSCADAIANYAKEKNIPWKFHTLIWGSQYPSWMNGLSASEQREEIIEWFDAAAKRYPDVQMIDVVNEAYMSDPNNWNAGKHAPIPFREALGGTGPTGFEWIVTSFKMARERWPNAILIYNDYNTLEWPNEINWIKQIIQKLAAAGAPIDAVGFQAHGLKGTSAATLKSRLDDIYNAIKLPMLISEYDIGETNDQAQLDNYKAHIPVMWNHPGVAGITIWGYIYGSTWVEGTGLIRNGQERPALVWLKEFIKDNPDPPNDYPNLLNGGGRNYRLNVITRGRGTVNISPEESSYEKNTEVTLTASAAEGWIFDGWSGDASGKQNPLTVSMNSMKTVTASFLTEDGKQDLVLNGTFSSGSDSWTFNNWSGSGSGAVVNGEYSITVSKTGDNYYDIQVVQPGILLEKDKAYRVLFDAYASDPRTLKVNVGMPEEPWTGFLTNVFRGESEVNLTTTKHTFSFDFVMEKTTYDDSRIEFSVGLNTPTVYIDNVSLYEIEPSAVLEPVHKKKREKIKIQQKGTLLTIAFDSANKSSASINIFDLRGNLIRFAEIKSHSVRNYSINTAGISKGFYIIKIDNGINVIKSSIVLTGN